MEYINGIYNFRDTEVQSQTSNCNNASILNKDSLTFAEIYRSQTEIK